ncbi:MAG: leucine--tRNA ligase [Chloroflexi bacterium]|nr:leucine--tRNA ligase [Chloroflexota bacterium]MCL5107886.1 leucine--tRNA ligase [Chloroflexota bacterium]
MAKEYKPTEIEPKWQARWAEDRLYEAHEDPARQKYYTLVMFPYPSGDLHVGHWYNYAPADAFARFQRMHGFNVMHPIGFDAFGLPAENAAVKRGIHPFTWTVGNIERMREQLRSLGSVFDWSREVATCFPDYYRWNQWLFLQFYNKGLAYKAKKPANWCPSCNTVLANEQVVDGACERCGTIVTRRDIDQWLLRITDYADELLDFSRIDWPEKIKIMQTNWIGRSTGAEIVFRAESGQEIPVFTTRPDTTFGVTFMVLAPEHPLVEQLTTSARRQAVDEYVEQARRATEIERLSTEREKTGVFIGSYCLNPLNGERVPIWVGDYVLYTYGTGAVMGVPAHDTRDFVFARRYGLPIPVVIAPPGWEGGELPEAYVGEGAMVNSGQFDDLPSKEGIERVIEYLEEHGLGKRRVNYRIRDWLISRQRYWGTPIPIVYCDTCGVVPVPVEDLPVLLPEDAEFRPTGESPLKLHHGFVNTTCPICGQDAVRETDTMDTFVDSSWYFLRYTSPNDDREPWDREKVGYWLPVDQYMGGAEHAVMHLLYSRFFVKALRDMGLLDIDEPFTHLFNQGIITKDGTKMSKSRGNVVNPDDFVSRMGADTVRAYLMFIGPWDQGGDWSDQGIAGVYRYMNRAWNLVQAVLLAGLPSGEPAAGEQSPGVRDLRRWTHKTIRRVTEDIERFRFNTMLAALMEFTNYLGSVQGSEVARTPAWSEAIRTLLLLLAPTAPHLAEEMWHELGLPYSIHNQPWPSWNEALAAEEQITLVVQVDGKVRERLNVPVGIGDEEAKGQALASANVRKFLDNRRVANVVYVPGRLVNIVTAK